MQFEDITKKIIGCAMKVHSALWNWFQEVIYQRALEIEFNEANLNFSREYEMEIFYKWKQIWTRRVDFFVENEIMVELKAIIKLEEIHLSQSINYLEAYNLKIWLLINFWSKSLEIKRVFNNKKL